MGRPTNFEEKYDWKLVVYLRASVKLGCHQSLLCAQMLVPLSGVYAITPLSKRASDGVSDLNLAYVRADITTSSLFECSTEM